MKTYLSAEMYESSRQVRVGQNTNQRQYTNYHWFYLGHHFKLLSRKLRMLDFIRDKDCTCHRLFRRQEAEIVCFDVHVSILRLRLPDLHHQSD